MEPWFNDLQFSDIPGITINIRFPSKSYNKMYGAGPRFNDLRFNDIPGLTMGILFPECKIFPIITVKLNGRPQEMLNILDYAPSALSS